MPRITRRSTLAQVSLPWLPVLRTSLEISGTAQLLATVSAWTTAARGTQPWPNVFRPVRLSAMVEVEADIRRLLRGPRHQRIVDDQIPDRRREVGDEDLAEALSDGNPGPLSAGEPFEIGGPLSARRDGEQGLGDESPISDHGADEEFEEGQSRTVRNGPSQDGQPGA